MNNIPTFNSFCFSQMEFIYGSFDGIKDIAEKIDSHITDLCNAYEEFYQQGITQEQTLEQRDDIINHIDNKLSVN